MSKEKIRVLVYEAGRRPEVREIPSTLEAMQEIVGGNIEGHTLAPNLHVICNADGKGAGLGPVAAWPAIDDVVCGRFLVSRCDPETGDDVDLLDGDIAIAKRALLPIPGGILRG